MRVATLNLESSWSAKSIMRFPCSNRPWACAPFVSRFWQGISNYKARDFDFSTVFKATLAGLGGGNLPLAKTAARHLPGSADVSPARLMYRVPVQASADGNTVEMDVERAQFSENAVQYEAGLTFITSQIKTLMAAVQGQ
jgi:flagellar basal-body rod protein FlgB